MLAVVGEIVKRDAHRMRAGVTARNRFAERTSGFAFADACLLGQRFKVSALVGCGGGVLQRQQWCVELIVLDASDDGVRSGLGGQREYVAKRCHRLGHRQHVRGRQRVALWSGAGIHGSRVRAYTPVRVVATQSRRVGVLRAGRGVLVRLLRAVRAVSDRDEVWWGVWEDVYVSVSVSARAGG